MKNEQMEIATRLFNDALELNLTPFIFGPSNGVSFAYGEPPKDKTRTEQRAATRELKRYENEVRALIDERPGVLAVEEIARFMELNDEFNDGPRTRSDDLSGND